MELSVNTKIGELLDAYPFLTPFLVEKSSTFEKLKNPLLRKTVAQLASVSRAAALGGFKPDELLAEIASQIYLQGHDVALVHPGGGKEAARPTSREERVRAFKDIVMRVHGGESVDAVREEFHDLLRDVSPAEIGAMEQELVKEGVDESEIKKLCNLHVELFEQSVQSALPEMEPGHPIHTMQAENRMADEKAEQLQQSACRIADDLSFAAARSGLLEAVNDLAEIIRHYERKENQLFPLMEAHDLTAPPQVMWAIHDDIRAAFKQTRAALEAEDRETSVGLVSELAVAIRDLIHKEEQILFPMVYETFSDEDWARVRQGEEEIGFAWVEPGSVWQAPAITAEKAQQQPGLVSLDAGQLRPEVINAILKTLPIDLSFVDANDRVAYFTQTAHRVFPRSEGILGREVKHCHPKKSVHMVEEILEKFKSGERDEAEFWIQAGGSFIHIRFYAVRQEDGAYEGCLEVAQDATHIRALAGQQRLLDWD